MCTKCIRCAYKGFYCASQHGGWGQVAKGVRVMYRRTQNVIIIIWRVYNIYIYIYRYIIYYYKLGDVPATVGRSRPRNGEEKKPNKTPGNAYRGWPRRGAVAYKRRRRAASRCERICCEYLHLLQQHSYAAPPPPTDASFCALCARILINIIYCNIAPSSLADRLSRDSFQPGNAWHGESAVFGQLSRDVPSSSLCIRKYPSCIIQRYNILYITYIDRYAAAYYITVVTVVHYLLIRNKLLHHSV